jgi:hypothetical protein
MEKTAYEYYLESENKEQFIIDKVIEWGISEDELLIILNNTNKIVREKQYPKIVDQLDLLWHDINNGILGEGAKESTWFTAIKEIKDNYPKPTN